MTGDANRPHQQNTTAVRLLIVVLRAQSNRLADPLPLVAEANAALDGGQPGEVVHVPAR